MSQPDKNEGSKKNSERYKGAKERPEVNYPTLEAVTAEISSDSYMGWCTYCGDWTHDCCEPDAHEYECPECGNRTCYGAEELVVRDMYK